MTAPAYGFMHRGRVLRPGGADGHYVVSVPTLAPGCASGPFQSTIRDLAVGDNVLLAQIGLTGGDLVIIGRLPERPPDFTLPIAISDVSGLQTALNDRATDAELAAVNSALTASILTEHNTNTTQNTRLDGIDTLNTTQNSRLTAVEGVNTTQDGRLTTAEGTITSHTGTLSTHTSQITALQTYAQVFRDAHEFDVYGDVIGSFPRTLTTNTRTLTAQAAYIWRTRLRLGVGFNRVRVIVQTAGTGASGSCTASLLTSSTAAGPYTVAGTANNTLTATGVQDFTFASTANVAAGIYVVLLLWVNNSYTVLPKIVAMQNNVQVAGSLNPTIVFGTKVGQTTAPTSVTITDGTWTAEVNPWWIAAAN